MSDAEIATRAGPSVVQVVVPDGLASGVAIAAGILTNQHVVDGATRIEVVSSRGQRVQAQVLRSNATSDLALLSAPGLNVPTLELEPAGQQRQGDALLVLGYPMADLKELGGQATLTRGLVSAVRQQSDGVTLLQTDAAVNAGNSGGPLLNSRANVVAVVSFGIARAQGLSFGMATETIRAFLDGPGGIAPPTRVLFRDDPRSVSINLSDLPNGGSGWTKVREDTSRLDRGIYEVVFGKVPTPGARITYPDPLMIAYLVVTPSVEAAQTGWREDFSKLVKGERAGNPPQIADDQMYGLLPSVIDVRVRDKNVLIQVVEVTSGQQAISLDDTLTMARVIVARVNARLR
jgi:hypothetical protein